MACPQCDSEVVTDHPTHPNVRVCSKCEHAFNREHRFVVKIQTTEQSEHLTHTQLRDAIEAAICYWIEEGAGPFRDEAGAKLHADWKVE